MSLSANATTIWLVAIFVCIAYGTITLLDGLIHFPRKMDKHASKVYTAALQEKEGILDKMIIVPVRLVARLIDLPSHRHRILANDLRRAEIDQSPEEYTAIAIVKAVLTGILGLLVLVMGIPIAAVGLIGLAVMVYIKETNRISDRIKKKDEAILGVLPHFVSVITEQLTYDSDLLRIFERYMRDVPDSPLTVDLLECTASMRANANYITSLLRLDASVGLTRFTPFITALIETIKGYDQTAYFQICASEMEVLEQENIERIIAKRPKKIKRATLAMMAAFMLMLIVPIIMQIVNTMSQVL